MHQLEGPGSEARLQRIQARFRALRMRAGVHASIRGARPVARDFLLFFGAFLTFGAAIGLLIE